MTREEAIYELKNAAWLGTDHSREEREAAIAYIKGYRKLDEDLHNTAPKDSISYYATDKCLKYWDMAIQALSQVAICPGYKINCEDCPAYEPCDECRNKRTSFCGNCKEYDEFEPCDDAISREAVKELIKCGVSTDTYDDVEQVCKWIDALPSVTQKSGKWKEVYAETDYRNGWIEFTCPNCEYQHGLENGEYGWSYGDPIPWKYCPVCGCEMKEGAENE